jgi:hypothetical protein
VNPVQGIDQDRDIGDASREQVAEALGLVCAQPLGVPGFEVPG